MTYPLPTLAAQVTVAGITAPSYADILASLKASFRSIYGSDAYLEADSQDGQLLAVFARSIHDCNQMAISVYNSFSPTSAQGAGLSSVVKINGISRLPATKSQVNVTLTGVVGTVINNGVVADTNKNRWDLPPVVTIPVGGSIVVTATAQNAGNISALTGTVTTIITPVAGWQAVTNIPAATPGVALETDAQLRGRQAQSVSLPAMSIMGALLGAVKTVPGVSAARIYENEANSTDSNGLPAHSIAVVAQGGDAAAIAQVIMDKKSPGVATHGAITQNLIDQVGVTQVIKLSVPTPVRVLVAINIKGLTGYASDVGDAIKSSVRDFINQIGIGNPVYFTRLYGPALQIGTLGQGTFEVLSIQISKHPAAVAAADITIAWNEIANCALSDMTLTVT